MTPGAAPAKARETLRFPGEDGGKSLAEMAQRDLDATLQLLAERAQYITGASGAAIALREGENMICCASAGAAAPELGAHLQVDSGLSAESVRSRKILHCDDAENDPRVNRESCQAFGIKSVMVMPLLRGEEVYGVFELLAGRPRAFEERDYIALQRLSEMIQTAVEHADAARRAEAFGTAATVNSGAEATNSAPVTGTSRTTPEQPAPKNKAAVVNQNSTLEPAGPPLLAEVDTRSIEGKTGQGPDPVAPIAVGRVRNCAGCGFPISEGRRLCLDCEAATPDVDLGGDAAQPFAELSESSPSWLRSHVYVVATLLLVVATIAVVVWRL
jgi:putative methionine-R-sulfoxide reductase with GAF domain